MTDLLDFIFHCLLLILIANPIYRERFMKDDIEK